MKRTENVYYTRRRRHQARARAHAQAHQAPQSQHVACCARNGRSSAAVCSKSRRRTLRTKRSQRRTATTLTGRCCCTRRRCRWTSKTTSTAPWRFAYVQPRSFSKTALTPRSSTAMRRCGASRTMRAFCCSAHGALLRSRNFKRRYRTSTTTSKTSVTQARQTRTRLRR